MCDPLTAALVIGGTGMQYAASRSNEKAQRAAVRQQQGFYEQGLAGQREAFEASNRDVVDQAGRFTPEATGQRVEQQVGQLVDSANNTILSQNLAYRDSGEDVRAGGSLSDTYERAYAQFLADDAEDTNRNVRSYASIAAPGMVAIGDQGGIARTGEQIAMRQNDANMGSSIAGSAASITQPQFSPWAGVVGALGGAATQAGLGKAFSAGWPAGAAPGAGTVAPGSYSFGAGGAATPWGGVPLKLPQTLQIPKMPGY